MSKLSINVVSKLGAAGLLTAITLGLTSQAQAVDISCDTAKLIVPWKAGGGTDVVFRKFADAANKSGARPQLQIINIPGQGGNKGAKEAKRAKPDGCTLVAIHQSAITSYFTGRVDFTWDAFEPVSLLSRTSSFVGASSEAPYNNLEELIVEAKKRPGEITAGGTFGSVSQFLFLLIEDSTGIKFRHVSYDGTKERVTALLANNIDIGEINLTAATKYIAAGDMKALAVMGEVSETPDVKTAKEQGVNVVFGVERGIMLPKGTSPEIIAHYETIFKKASQDQALQTSLKKTGTDVVYKNAADYTSHMQSTYDKWLSIAKKIGAYKR
ncbi:Bug family tripartite tricarboxylate transporter substrate binding protein [Kiloniella antarctica]|uniref:Bug family tripartite tricarboxylate transporter substrate binding protein n=1 Tax=Kiloniella antarctica TaxID=1550907 RepID=A0ABW5BRY5_9PROT